MQTLAGLLCLILFAPAGESLVGERALDTARMAGPRAIRQSGRPLLTPSGG